jgi:DNA-directed RNA polymerase subunit RPC12/RpoP
MIRYTCENCGAALETDAAPGTREECPACSHVNAILQPRPSVLSRLSEGTSRVLQALRKGAAAAKQERAAARDAENRAKALAHAEAQVWQRTLKAALQTGRIRDVQNVSRSPERMIAELHNCAITLLACDGGSRAERLWTTCRGPAQAANLTGKRFGCRPQLRRLPLRCCACLRRSVAAHRESPPSFLERLRGV